MSSRVRPVSGVVDSAGDEAAAMDAEEMRRRLRAAAHEIRTPLTGAATLADLLAASDLQGVSRDYAVLLKDVIDHLVAVTNDMLDLGRLEADAGLGPRETFSPAALLSSVASAARLQAAQRDVAVHLMLKDLPDWSSGFPVLVRRVLENLVNNAVKHTHRGAITLVAEAPGARLLRLVVADTGDGIAPENVQAIFEPYAQLAAGRQAGGTGL